METKKTHIAILEPSEIIYEGFSNVILKAKRNTYIYWILDFSELEKLIENTTIDIVIINPSVTYNREQEFNKFKKNNLNISWLALVYSFYEDHIIKQFNNTLMISDSTDMIIKKINDSTVKSTENVAKEQLSEREKDVLIQLVNGLSNKEIANVLNISTHTVISHRKNIVEKTGIRSLPGLTIFAISQNIASMDQTPV